MYSFQLKPYLRQPVLHVTSDDVPDVIVGILSKTGSKVMQKGKIRKFEIEKLNRCLLLVSMMAP